MIVCLFVFRNGQVFLSAILVDFLTGEEGRGLFDCHHKPPAATPQCSVLTSLRSMAVLSPRGFSALARLYYLATKTAMLRRLCPHDLNAWNRLSNKHYWANSPFSHRPQCTLFYSQILHNHCFHFLLGIILQGKQGALWHV